MAVTIVPMPLSACLRVEGDVCGVLTIPAESPETLGTGEVLVDTYFISLSDGSLVQASLHDDPEFDVIVKGAGCVRIEKEGRAFSLDWRVEWVNLGAGRGSTALAHTMQSSLPLFDRLAKEAA